MSTGKNLLKKIIVSLLRFEASLVLKKYKPKIIGVAGSVGKTSAKEAIALVLSRKYRVRKSEKSFNHDLGIPLTILGCRNAWWNVFGWLKNLLEGASLILFRTTYPEWLVLEVGVEYPGDMAWVTSWIKFDVVVFTRLPDLPVHVEYFPSTEALVAEKLKLPQAVGPEGLLILNHDDEKIMAARSSFRAPIVTYGWRDEATVRASEEHFVYNETSLVSEGATERRKLPDGVGFMVNYRGASQPFRLEQILAFHQIYSVLAAVTVGLSFGLELADLAEVVRTLPASPGRFRLLPGVKETMIIDDSYNASPVAVAAALQVFQQLEISGRKIFVFGDMMELGSHTIEAHRRVGELAAPIADIIITVGLRAQFTDEELVHRHFAKTKHFHFDDSASAALKLQTLLKPGDLVLVKGSQAVRLEKVVEEVMANPEEKEAVLVRQEPEWQKR